MAPLFSLRGFSKPVPKGIFDHQLQDLMDNPSIKDLRRTNSVVFPKKVFSLEYVKVSPSQLKQLGDVLAVKPVLELRIVGGGILPSGLKELQHGLRQNPFLRKICLSENPLGDTGIAILEDVVKFRTNIESLELADTKFTVDGSFSISEMLKLNKNLTELVLSDNSIQDEGVKLIAEGVCQSPLGEKPKMKRLIFSNCDISSSSAAFVTRMLLAAKDTLEEVDLSSNRITAVGIKKIARAFRSFSVESEDAMEMNGIRKLVLDNNFLGDEGVKSVARNISVNGTLNVLSLQNVGMKSKGLSDLCSYLAESSDISVLTSLFIGNNDIQKGGVVQSLIGFLSNSPTIESLSLEGIPLSLDDHKEFSEFLENRIKCRLVKLNLASTGISNEAAVYYSKALRYNMDVKEMNVTSNEFNALGAKAFAQVFKRAKTMEVFRLTGHSRIGAEGENYLAECLKFNNKILFKGVSKELDYMEAFIRKNRAFKLDSEGNILGWSEEAWEVVKRGCGQIIGTVIYKMDHKTLKNFKQNVVLKSRNVVNQNMFEYVLRHAESPAADVVSIFMNRCKISLDDWCSSKASVSMSKEKRASDDVTYRVVAAECSKDPMVKEMAKNNTLFMARYLSENGPAIHETHEIKRILAKDTLSDLKNEEVVVQVYQNEMDFMREKEAREDLKEKLRAAGPFAIYDVILREKNVHEDAGVISFKSSICDLRNSIQNLGVTAGYDMNQTIHLAKQAAQSLGSLNNLGRIHGDFKPRNLLKVAKARMGDNPYANRGHKVSSKVMLPEKWVLFDLSKSVPHGHPVSLRMDSSYLPPEVARVTFNENFQEKQLLGANEKMDVWAFGVVLYQLLTGTHLFHTESSTDRIFKSKERLELMNWITLDDARQKLIMHRASEAQFANETTFKRIKDAAVDLVNWCLQGDPHNRPGFNDILSHPFFVYKTQEIYSDIDLLLGWYNKIGSSYDLKGHKNNRTHSHVANARGKHSMDVLKSLQSYYRAVGCKLTSDAEDWKIDVSMRREMVQKSKSLIVLLNKGVFFKPEVMKKVIWAIDSTETTSLILLDISTGFTGAEKFDFDECLTALADVTEPVNECVEALLPLEEKLGLVHLDFEKSNDLKKQKKWLIEFIESEVRSLLESLRDKVVPYRTRAFQGQAMADEIIRRTGFYSKCDLRSFSLQDNNKELVHVEANKENDKRKQAQVLIMYNGQAPVQNLQRDALKLRSKMLALENKNYKAEVHVVDDPKDVKSFFTPNPETGLIKAERLTLVMCIVSKGFFEVFRDSMVELNRAEGPVSIVPISYGQFDVKVKDTLSELMNVGLESSAVLTYLKDQKSYIPLPASEKNLEYETSASLSYIYSEASKQLDINIKNKDKDNNAVWDRYENTNFYRTVY